MRQRVQHDADRLPDFGDESGQVSFDHIVTKPGKQTDRLISGDLALGVKCLRTGASSGRQGCSRSSGWPDSRARAATASAIAGA